MNRLQHETSPYLLQHADNPVDWFPWGEEAFEKAKAENKPILLSVGYSACHWCHVMAHESFEHEPTANIMNEWFINVKVDREERPDVDDIYMQAVQAMNNGQGGWPMTVFMMPDGRPFFGNDPSAALKNLPAEVISKIEVFDQKSDQANFTGFDDGETTKTMNIVTKKNMRAGQFGKVQAGYGYEDKYGRNKETPLVDKPFSV